MVKKLAKLLADNRGKGFLKAEHGNEEATIYLYDVIVDDAIWGGVSAKDFVKEIKAIKAPVINLRINSPGGDVFGARAMEAAIAEHDSQIIAHIDGQAASAATYVALAADRVKISEGGFFMIHKAWSIALGNTDEMLHMAELLEKIDQTLVNTYAKRSNQDAAEIAAMMARETWLNASEALDMGFVDEIVTTTTTQQNKWNLSAYQNAPEIMQLKVDMVDESWQLSHMQRMAALARHL
jgi:ATP-dependent Clp protease, protease subunit